MISVGVQTWGTDLAALRRYWAAAESLGYQRLTCGDGLWAWTHDGWTMLGALAILTRRVRIGPAVTYCFDASSHHPSWLAKAAVTVDHLSNGRLDLRLGVGAEDPGAAEFWQSHGIPYPEAGERVEILAEGIQLVKALWAGEPVEFHGRFFHMKGATLVPRPVQLPHPPVWLAAMGSRALGVAAQHADGWEASYLAPGAFAEKVEQLRMFLAREGREPKALRCSVEVDVILGQDSAEARSWRDRYCRARGIPPDHQLLDTALVGESSAVLERIAQYRAAGVTDLMCAFADFPETGMLARFAEQVLPELIGQPDSEVAPSREHGG